MSFELTGTSGEGELEAKLLEIEVVLPSGQESASQHRAGDYPR